MIHLENLIKTYKKYPKNVMALKGVTVDIPFEKLVCVVGVSGSGKTTLLKLISGKLLATSGELDIDGYSLVNKSLQLLHHQFKREIRYISQYPEGNLWTDLSIKDNYKLLLAEHKIPRKKRNYLIIETLRDVGLEYLDIKQIVKNLSGGEQQRLGLGMAISVKPKILLCDEITGNVDRNTSLKLLILLKNLIGKYNLSIIIASHDELIKEYSDVLISISDGRISHVIKEYTNKKEELKRNVEINISEGGTITLPASFISKLSPFVKVYAELTEGKVILHFNGEKND